MSSANGRGRARQSEEREECLGKLFLPSLVWWTGSSAVPAALKCLFVLAAEARLWRLICRTFRKRGWVCVSVCECVSAVGEQPYPHARIRSIKGNVFVPIRKYMERGERGQCVSPCRNVHRPFSFSFSSMLILYPSSQSIFYYAVKPLKPVQLWEENGWNSSSFCYWKADISHEKQHVPFRISVSFTVYVLFYFIFFQS